jgi:tetratricopeptide (TPR) repeat protein
MLSDEMKQVLEHYNEGRKLYKLMEFQEAKNCFARALKANPDDGPSRVYYARCKHYMESPPPEDWDGVFVMQTK